MSGALVGDVRLFCVVLGAALALFAFLGAVTLAHERNLGRIGLRVHVAGTRGKSHVVRLIAAALRAGGQRVLAKTTGTEPRLIAPDGSERRVRRLGAASISEQRRMIAAAAVTGADAAVIECMAIRPEFVRASERYLVRAHLAVLTNLRPDHFEDIGVDPQFHAAALHEVVPRGGQLVVADEAASPALAALAGERGCIVTVVATKDLAPEAANRALARAACRVLGVADEIARIGFESALADPGAFVMASFDAAGKRVRFANAFACNDVESLARLWRAHGEPSIVPAIVLLNARPDRPLRTRAFLAYLTEMRPRPIVFIAGARTGMARMARDAGFPAERLRHLATDDPARALATLAEAASDGATIWGIGNYRGLGQRISAALTAKGTVESPTC